MIARSKFPRDAGSNQSNLQGLSDKHDHGRLGFKEFMVGIDRIAGTTVLVCLAGLSVWLISQTVPMTLFDVPGATASSTHTASYNAPNLNARVAAEPMTAADLRKLQSKLEGLGFEPGVIDGIAGGRTLDALNRYRAAKHLNRVFQIDYATVAGLLD
jgi:hypothetical protein